MASTLTINERTYDAGTLHVAHGRNIKGEPCLQLAGIPVRGMDPHALADLAYPDAATPYAGSLANAAQRALMLLSDMHEPWPICARYWLRPSVSRPTAT